MITYKNPAPFTLWQFSAAYFCGRTDFLGWDDEDGLEWNSDEIRDWINILCKKESIRKLPIKKPKIYGTTCQLHHVEHGFLFEICGDYELNDVRLQIARAGVHEEYFIKWEGHEIIISKTGRLSEWPKGFFDLIDKQLDELCDLDYPPAPSIQVKNHLTF